MSTLIKDRYLLYFIYTVLFILSIPLISTILEIIFKFGNIVGSFIRSYGC
jgi:hypothetical protein